MVQMGTGIHSSFTAIAIRAGSVGAKRSRRRSRIAATARGVSPVSSGGVLAAGAGGEGGEHLAFSRGGIALLLIRGQHGASYTGAGRLSVSFAVRRAAVRQIGTDSATGSSRG